MDPVEPHITSNSLSLALGPIGRGRRGKLRLSWSSKNGVERGAKAYTGNELALV